MNTTDTLLLIIIGLLLPAGFIGSLMIGIVWVVILIALIVLIYFLYAAIVESIKAIIDAVVGFVKEPIPHLYEAFKMLVDVLRGLLDGIIILSLIVLLVLGLGSLIFLILALAL